VKENQSIKMQFLSGIFDFIFSRPFSNGRLAAAVGGKGSAQF